jgi:hypothetical protein
MSHRQDDEAESLDQFWLHYLREHASPATRAVHFLGSTVAALCIAADVFSLDPLLPLAGILTGYGFAWMSHWLLEKNRPTMLAHPVWSLLCDVRMTGLWYARRLQPELARAGVGAGAELPDDIGVG